MFSRFCILFFFFFNDTATTEIYTLSLHDALPIPPGAADALARTVEAVLADPDGTARMALAAREQAAARFGTAAAAKAYAAVYAEALQPRSAKGRRLG